MRFSVPQFIDVEDKLIGPLTLKQSIYLAGGAAGSYIAYRILGAVGVMFIGVPLFIFAILLGFVRINNRPFGLTVAAAFFFKLKNKLYLWKKAEKTSQKNQSLQTRQASSNQSVAPELTQSKLRALAFSLDSEDGYSTKDA